MNHFTAILLALTALSLTSICEGKSRSPRGFPISSDYKTEEQYYDTEEYYYYNTGEIFYSDEG